MNPKVSIIVPIYGVEKYLRQCVDSILSQTLKEIEVILVDDGSPDGCPAIVDEYAAKDSRILAVHQENGGYGRAINHGLSLAKGDYIGIVEPDDWIEHEMYEFLYSRASKDDLDIMKSNFTPICISNKIKASLPNQWRGLREEGEVLTAEQASYFFVHHPSIWTCIYRREFINENSIRMQESLGASWQDNLFQVQTLCLVKRFGFTHRAFYNYRSFATTNSEALKDWRIPFARIDEIYDYLKSKEIFRSPFTAYLGIRHLSYIEIAVGATPSKDWPECKAKAAALASILPIEEMLAYVSEKDAKKLEKRYLLLRDNPDALKKYVIRRNRRKFWLNFRRWLINVRVQNGAVQIVFLGRVFSLALIRKAEGK
jgi:glycosyltransferase involved in cell wall biosynthesis